MILFSLNYYSYMYGSHLSVSTCALLTYYDGDGRDENDCCRSLHGERCLALSDRFSPCGCILYGGRGEGKSPQVQDLQASSKKCLLEMIDKPECKHIHIEKKRSLTNPQN